MYFPDRGCVRPLRHLYGYATAPTAYDHNVCKHTHHVSSFSLTDDLTRTFYYVLETNINKLFLHTTGRQFLRYFFLLLAVHHLLQQLLQRSNIITVSY